MCLGCCCKIWHESCRFPEAILLLLRVQSKHYSAQNNFELLLSSLLLLVPVLSYQHQPAQMDFGNPHFDHHAASNWESVLIFTAYDGGHIKLGTTRSIYSSLHALYCGCPLRPGKQPTRVMTSCLSHHSCRPGRQSDSVLPWPRSFL